MNTVILPRIMRPGSGTAMYKEDKNMYERKWHYAESGVTPKVALRQNGCVEGGRVLGGPLEGCPGVIAQQHLGYASGAGDAA